jgi:hypothetical protein
MDDQTRFWIAQEVADTKYTADLRPLFQLGKRVAEKQPKTLITGAKLTLIQNASCDKS